MTNHDIARVLESYADELEKAGNQVYRARSYRTAASNVRRLTRTLGEILQQEGREGLEALPGIGKSLAYTIEGLVRGGEIRTLRPVDAHQKPNEQLLSLPGVGPRLAERLRDDLGITTLEQLHSAARAGRLGQLGVGRKRLVGLLAALEQRLKPVDPPADEPSVEVLLDLDREYRARLSEGELPQVSPRRFNPEAQRWLGILRTTRGAWQFRVMFSNTSLAHRLGKTSDWVVVYFDDGTRTGQRTVVTETTGDLQGRRVVRGREQECRVQVRAA